MNNSEIDRMVSDKVRAKVRELKSVPVGELLKLPRYTGIKFEVGDKEQELGVWHEATANGAALFVVQCKNTRFLGIGNMHAEGFLLTLNSEIADAPEELMWDTRSNM